MLHPPDLARRLWRKDPTLWPGDPEAIRNRLGWLDLPGAIPDRIAPLKRFAGDLKAEGIRQVLLLGMGGSSLFPAVLAAAFGPAEGHPSLKVLDTTAPEDIRAAGEGLDPARTFVLVSSKSGSTLEVDALYRHFRAVIKEARRFAVITDPLTPLERLAREAGFRACFEAPSDVGGRFSALSVFGLLPAAVLGLDPGRLLQGAKAMANACGPDVPDGENPAVRLGRDLARRDRLPLLLPSAFEAFGAWIEQLVAESTGKDGKGILPLPGEPGPEAFRFSLSTLEDLGAACFQWEMATAVAGSLMGVNPFDEPDVAASKRLTRDLLEAAKPPALPPAPDAAALKAFLAGARPGETLALLAYLPETAPVRRALQALRGTLGIPSTLGFGPRYLHSTGQLHKGGSDRGIFLILIREDVEALPIPGLPYGFETLQRAQALGDLEALRRRGRRVLACPLRGDPVEALARLGASVDVLS
jgi:hypothetical protein